MKKLNDWWNKPITNGTIVKWYAKSAVYTIACTFLVNKWIEAKLESDNDTTVVYTTESEDKEV